MQIGAFESFLWNLASRHESSCDSCAIKLGNFHLTGRKGYSYEIPLTDRKEVGSGIRCSRMYFDSLSSSCHIVVN